MTTIKIDAPGGFVPECAIAFGKRDETSTQVDRDAPLPVQHGFAASVITPLAGTATASGAIGPFLPELGRPIWVTLGGSWSGTVIVQRSTDDGATRHPLTIGGAMWGAFPGNAQEVIGEESVSGASWWLDFSRTSGTLTYQVQQ